MANKEINYITGAHGFLGSHLVKALRDKTVVAIPHQKITSFTYEPFDRFFFLSAYGNLASQTDEKKIIKANVIDLIKTLEKVIDFDFNSFVFMSTSSVKLRIQTMYSRTKKAAEEILLAYMEKYHKPICVLRPFSITGVGEQKEHLIPTLIRSCLEGEPMNFVPFPTHDFIDVEDVVSGMLTLSQKRAKGIFELGTGISYTNQQVLELVEKITGKKANIKRIEKLRDYDTTSWVSTNFRVRGYGWLPRKSLEQSIKEQVEDYEEGR